MFKMTDLSNKSCLIWDNGIFFELSLQLAKQFGKVVYFNPWQSSFPKSNQTLIGTGFNEVETTNNFFDYVDDVDIIVFPDVYQGGVSSFLAERGHKVWASMRGEELEMYRRQSKEYMSKLGIPIGMWVSVVGISALRDYLKTHDNQYVKISLTRGDMETFHSENYKIVESKLDDLEKTLGAKKFITEFIIEEAIEPAVEIGTDTYCIDGVFPSGGLCGIEVKDKGYVCQYKDFNDMPEQVTSYNKLIAPTLKKYGYRNFISSELRVTPDLIPYMIDPTMRAGSPPSEIYINMYDNLADIIWNGAQGICIDPIVSKKYAVQAILTSSWVAEGNWQVVQFPAELRDNIKFKYLTQINGDMYVIPQYDGHSEIGALVCTGDTLQEAIDSAKDMAKEIKAFDIDVHVEAIEQGLGELDTLREWGIDLIG
jgi:hypothetical protein